MMLEHYTIQMKFALCEGAIWTCEGCLALVVWMDRDLMIAKLTIQVAKEGVVN
jgi:hypothetical protein